MNNFTEQVEVRHSGRGMGEKQLFCQLLLAAFWALGRGKYLEKVRENLIK